MDKDQVKGNIKDAVGKVQEKAGKMTGSQEHERKGVQKQAEGKTQEAWGDAKEAVRNATKR